MHEACTEVVNHSSAPSIQVSYSAIGDWMRQYSVSLGKYHEPPLSLLFLHSAASVQTGLQMNVCVHWLESCK